MRPSRNRFAVVQTGKGTHPTLRPNAVRDLLADHTLVGRARTRSVQKIRTLATLAGMKKGKRIKVFVEPGHAKTNMVSETQDG